MIPSSVKVTPKALICEDAIIRGDVTILPGCVIHTSATILAEAGPIVLGESCIVEEYAVIRHCPSIKSNKVSRNPILNIGPNNIFEVGCVVEASKIGEKNLFESKCYVGPGATIADRCIIGAGVQVDNQAVPDDTIIYKNVTRRETIEKLTSQTLQIDFLRKILPNYHHIRKPNFDPKKLQTPTV